MIVQEDIYLAHIGVLGMRWGNSRNPAKLAIKNDKLAKKIVNLDIRAAKSAKAAIPYQQKLNKTMIKNITRDLSRWEIRKAKVCARNLESLTKKSARLTLKSAKYSKKIFKNERFVAKLNSKVTDLKARDMSIGKMLIDGEFKD